MNKTERAERLNEYETEAQSELARKIIILNDTMRRLPKMIGDEIAKRTTDYHKQTVIMDKATDNLIKIQDTMKSTTQEIVNHSQAMGNYTSRLPTKKDLLGTLTAFCVLGVMLGALIGVAMTYFVYIPGQETQERAETMDRLIALSTPEEIQKMNEILQRTSRPSTNKRSD